MAEHVELDLPLTARHAITVRAVAASMASSAGLSVDDIEDLRLGVNEAVSVLTDVDEDQPGVSSARLRVKFEVEPGWIAVSAHRTGLTSSAPAMEIDALARRILNAVVDEFSLGDDGVVLLVKRVPIDASS